MGRVLPSQAVALIDSIFPWAVQVDGTTGNVTLNVGQSGIVAVIVNAVEQIPSELITLEGNDYAAFFSSLTTLKHALEMWPSRGPTFDIKYTPGFPKLSPITLLRSALAKCADDAPIIGTAELAFITDKDFRDSLRRDVSTAHTALTNGEWKPSTVIAGSVVEALLLWALQQENTTDITNSVTNLVAAKRLPKSPGNDLLNWTLNPLIEVSRDLKVIDNTTADQCRIAKDFRNLIHPGRAERLKINCSRSTALSAVAAMEHVIEDLQ
ncbi:MAG TPA: hypothetical protein VJ464_02000 [Blastocatellia bacterium]|nr:hypothetical protein [Blastocatellia bacterium]